MKRVFRLWALVVLVSIHGCTGAIAGENEKTTISVRNALLSAESLYQSLEVPIRWSTHQKCLEVGRPAMLKAIQEAQKPEDLRLIVPTMKTQILGEGKSRTLGC